MNILKLILLTITFTTVNASADDFTKTMCLPITDLDGKVIIKALCDTTEFNKMYNLDVDKNGCALPRQGIQEISAFALHQAPVTISAPTQEELDMKSLPLCENAEAAIIITIELQPWQR